MTLSAAMLCVLDARALDVELLVRLGFDSVRRGDGEALMIPFLREGRVVRRKYRRFDRAEGKWSADKGGVRLAWNEDCLRDDSLVGLPLIITEGELDAVAGLQSGLMRVISVPDGAPPPGAATANEDSRDYAWLEPIRPFLTKERVPEIILATDGDGPGAALMHDLSVLLGRYRCKFVTWPKARAATERGGRERLKDLNEVLEDYAEAGVRQTLDRAEWLKVDGVYRMSELPPLPPMKIYDIGFDAYGQHYRLRLGDFVVVTGIPSMGKTTFVHDLVCRCCVANGLTAAWASFEQTPQRDHKRAFREWRIGKPEALMSVGEKAAADAWVDGAFVFMVPGEDDDVTLEWLLEKAEAAVVRYGARIIVIDPWNEMDHLWGRQETEAQYINRTIKTLRRFARAFQVHLIVVAHPVKQVKGPDGKYAIPTLYDINGGAVWYNKADLGVIVHKDAQDQTIIKTAKSRFWTLIGHPGSVTMAYREDERRFYELERGAA